MRLLEGCGELREFLSLVLEKRRFGGSKIERK